MIEFTVDGVPESKGSWRAFVRNGKTVFVPDNDAEPSWAELVAWMAKPHVRGKPDKETRFRVELSFVLQPPPNKRRTNRRDLDKLARSVLDALTGIVWADDEQVDSLFLTKETSGEPGVRVRISPFN